jgi:hypothetical protein
MDPIPIRAVECESGVLHQEHIEAEIPRHADGGFHRIVGDYSGDHQNLLPRAA